MHHRHTGQSLSCSYLFKWTCLLLQWYSVQNLLACIILSSDVPVLSDAKQNLTDALRRSGLNWIAQINFGLKPKFDINFGFSGSVQF